MQTLELHNNDAIELWRAVFVQQTDLEKLVANNPTWPSATVKGIKDRIKNYENISRRLDVLCLAYEKENPID